MQNIGDRIRIPGAVLCSERISPGHERRIMDGMHMVQKMSGHRIGNCK